MWPLSTSQIIDHPWKLLCLCQEFCIRVLMLFAMMWGTILDALFGGVHSDHCQSIRHNRCTTQGFAVNQSAHLWKGNSNAFWAPEG